MAVRSDLDDLARGRSCSSPVLGGKCGPEHLPRRESSVEAECVLAAQLCDEPVVLAVDLVALRLGSSGERLELVACGAGRGAGTWLGL